MRAKYHGYLTAGLALLCLIMGATTTGAFAAAEPAFDGRDALFYTFLVALAVFVPTYVYVRVSSGDDRDAVQPE